MIVSGSEDGTVRVWHANTYRLENTLNYGLERVWSITYQRGSNNIGLGYDEGSIVIKVSFGFFHEFLTALNLARPRRSGREYGQQW